MNVGKFLENANKKLSGNRMVACEFHLFGSSHRLFTCTQPTPLKHDWLNIPDYQQTTDGNKNASDTKILPLAYRFCVHMQISVY